ncbi:MAG: ABC transporter permease [Candidatus Cloacimonetes bacterium]|nr:ABC transporter permease [Candidatus Cloacimonadota bacterium]
MFRFLAKGLLRDRSRSLFPIIVISAGVAVTVVMLAWIQGISGMIITENARFETGHTKVVTRAYAGVMNEKPFDLGILVSDSVLTDLEQEFPTYKWLQRIYFGGLLDLPDETGNSVSQGQVIGFGIDLFTDKMETELLNLEEALISGKLPMTSNQILLSDEVAIKMKANLGDKVTVISSTMLGSMAMRNFEISGTIKFGVKALDKGAVIVDIKEAQQLLDMENACSEILGFPINGRYSQTETYFLSEKFNEKFADRNDEFSLQMIPLMEQGELKMLLTATNSRVSVFLFIFIILMSLVLWNSGLMNGIRRYGEIGVRLAIGESKLHIYGSMILESVVIGLAGFIIGTIIGLGFAYLLQEQGVDISSMMNDASVIMNSKMQAQITPSCLYIGIIPGLLSTIIGSMFAGIGIFKRQTAQLFKELEA